MVVTNVLNPSTHMYLPLLDRLLETGLTDPGQVSGRFLGFITVVVMLQPSNTRFWYITMVLKNRDKRGQKIAGCLLLVLA